MDPDGTLYEILQVREDADQEVIEAAYKRLAFKYHPDRPGNDGPGLLTLNRAYDVMKDATKRNAYDELLRHTRQRQREQGSPAAEAHPLAKRATSTALRSPAVDPLSAGSAAAGCRRLPTMLATALGAAVLFALVVYTARENAQHRAVDALPADRATQVERNGEANLADGHSGPIPVATRDGNVYVTSPVTGETREVDPTTAVGLIQSGWIPTPRERAVALRAEQIVAEAVRREVTPAKALWFGMLDGSTLGLVRFAMPNVLFDVSDEVHALPSWCGRFLTFGALVFLLGSRLATRRGLPRASPTPQP